MSTPSLAVLCDYPEEGWLSMDLCADMLLRQLRARRPSPLRADRLCPPFRSRLGAAPWFGGRRFCRNADRLLNRIWDYPRYLRNRSQRYDCFHVVDHSYAHLVHVLPARSSGVYCHDLDTFRCLLAPETEPRPRWFRAVTRKILAGLQKAALVFYNSAQTAGELTRLGLCEPDRLIHAPLGVAPEFLLADDSPPESPVRGPYVLHVGSCIPRKRVDLLLEVFAELRRSFADLRLVKVGGEWSAAHAALIGRHGLADRIVHLHGLGRPSLACLYRGASLVLVPSGAEGFGLPVVEALACGAPVLASDLPSTREAGGAAAVYAPAGDLPAWVVAAERLLRNPGAAPPRDVRVAWGRRFSWERHAAILADAYLRLAGGPAGRPTAGGGAVVGPVGLGRVVERT